MLNSAASTKWKCRQKENFRERLDPDTAATKHQTPIIIMLADRDRTVDLLAQLPSISSLES